MKPPRARPTEGQTHSGQSQAGPEPNWAGAKLGERYSERMECGSVPKTGKDSSPQRRPVSQSDALQRVAGESRNGKKPAHSDLAHLDPDDELLADDDAEVLDPEDLDPEDLDIADLDPDDELLADDDAEDLDPEDLDIADLDPDDELLADDDAEDVEINAGLLVAEDVEESGALKRRVASSGAAAGKTLAQPDDEEGTAEEDDIDEEEDDDVEASLDVILKERLVAEELDDDDEVVDEPEARTDHGERIVPKQANEFVCQSCFLVKHRSQLADPKRQLCRDCV